MLEISNKSQVPPGGVFRYKDPERGITIEHPYLVQVQARATKFRLDNNLPIPVNWEELFEDNVCQNTPTCPCDPAEANDPTAPVRMPSVGRMASNFVQAIGDWARSGFAIASREVIEERMATCQGGNGKDRCQYWRKGTLWGRCGQCGCAGVLKTPLASEKCPLGKWKR